MSLLGTDGHGLIQNAGGLRLLRLNSFLPGQAGENASYFAVSTAIQRAHLRALPLWHMASN